MLLSSILLFEFKTIKETIHYLQMEIEFSNKDWYKILKVVANKKENYVEVTLCLQGMMPIDNYGYRLKIGNYEVSQYYGSGVDEGQGPTFRLHNLAGFSQKPIVFIGHSVLQTGALFPDFSQEIKQVGDRAAKDPILGTQKSS